MDRIAAARLVVLRWIGVLVAVLPLGCGNSKNEAEAPPGCSADQAECADQSVFLQSNATNCGSCGVACGPGASCVQGQCACPTGQVSCNANACTDVTRDSANCGSCGNSCGAGQSCSNGTCLCQPGYGSCDAGCTDLATDIANCGACGVVCSTGQLCAGTGCSCQDNLTSCGASCVDTTSSAANCGACGTVCGGTTPFCSLGTCAAECAVGLQACGNDCVDTQNSVENCGQCGLACSAGQICSSGSCGCPAGQALCDGVCVVIDTNPNHCGGCGITCTGGQQCAAGACACANSSETLCDNVCVDTQTSATHCGACGTTCEGGTQCVAGACACPNAGETQCNGVCTDTMSDPVNCGGCGIACDAAGTCDAGVCSSGGTGGSTGTGGSPPVIADFEPLAPPAYLRKVKNLTTGLAPTDQEMQALVNAPEEERAAVLRTMISNWINTEHTDRFEAKMIPYFVNLFQQKGFVPTEDFKLQLLENGGFDFNVLGFFGDTAFPALVRNIEESFARTAWEFVANNEPFTRTLTTNQFMMTTALMSTYLQIEMPNDEPYSFSNGSWGSCSTTADCEAGECYDGQCGPPRWKLDTSSTPIPIEDIIDPGSPNYLTFSDEPPINDTCGNFLTNCRDSGQVHEFGHPGFGSDDGPTGGYAQLFQRLIGFTTRHPFLGSPPCWEHCSKPYFTDSDVSDWRMVTIEAKPDGERYLQPYDLPGIRGAASLRLKLPRVGFFTTPAFLALWNTNDSNQHRVTANQALLVALNRSFTSENTINPTNMFGLDDVHAVEGSQCFGCHKSLDPIREFWENEFDFDDRNDFSSGFGQVSNARPTTSGGGFAFGNVNAEGSSMTELGSLMAQVTDSTSADPDPISRFAIAMTQYLCFWADSARCSERDPTFRAVARNFEASRFDFKTLYVDLLSSPLVTAAAATSTFEERDVMVSIVRRRHLCAALSTRLGVADICSLDVDFHFASGFSFGNDPLSAERATNRLAGSVPDDAFSRGTENPSTPNIPTLFYRAGSELVCEDVAERVIDVVGGLSSSDPNGAMTTMVEVVMGYPPTDPKHARALEILQTHYQDAGANANALKSTFSLACQSPSSLGMGI
jgi:hypothetical protein